MERNFVVKLTVPHLMYPVAVGKGRNAPRRLTYLENVSWRVFWWFLKSKLEAVQYGISDEFREFMPNIIHLLPEDQEGVRREMSLGDLILERADNLSRLSLEAPAEKVGLKVISAEFRVQE